MAARDEVLGLASETRDAAVRGEIKPEELTPKGQLLLRIGRGEADLDRISPQDRALIGLDPTLVQRVTESAPFKTFTAVTPPRYQSRPSETFFEPIKDAATGPTLTDKVMSLMPAAMEPGLLNLGGRMLSGGERVMNVAGSTLTGGARLLEQAGEQVPRLIGQEPASTPVSRTAGAIAEALSMILPGLKKPSEPAGPFPTNIKDRGFEVDPKTLKTGETVIRPDAPMAGPLALPAGEPFEIVPPYARTRSMLPPNSQKALPAGRQILRPTPVRQPRGPEALPPAVDVEPPMDALTGHVPGDVKALQDYHLGERPKPLPGEVPLGAEGEGGGLVVGRGETPTPATRGRTTEIRPGATTEPPPLREAPTPEKRPFRDDTPTVMEPPPVLEGELLDQQGRPVKAEPPAEPMSERERLRRLERTRLDAPAATTTDTPTALPPIPEGDLPTSLVAGARRRGEPPPPEPPPPVAASPEPPKSPPSAPSELPPPAPGPPAGVLSTKAPRGGRRAQINAQDVDLSDPRSVGAYIWGRGGLSSADIEGIPLHLRRKTGVGLDEIIDELATALGRPQKEVEAKVHRVLSRYRSQKEAQRGKPKADDFTDLGFTDEELAAHEDAAFRFFDEQAAKERGPSMSSILPPVPLPGPDENDEGTERTVKTAAQVLGLSLPLASMLFSRWRGRGARRPVQQGLDMETRPGGPQGGLFDAKPLPEVPEPPTRAAGSEKPVAPVRFGGMQERVNGEPFELWTLTDDIAGHPKGSTVARQTLEAQGYAVPDRTTAPRFEKTALGDQAVIPDTPPREMPKTPLTADVAQRDITETPLFGQERAAREAASDRAQGGLFEQGPSSAPSAELVSPKDIAGSGREMEVRKGLEDFASSDRFRDVDARLQTKIDIDKAYEAGRITAEQRTDLRQRLRAGENVVVPGAAPPPLRENPFTSERGSIGWPSPDEPPSNRPRVTPELQRAFDVLYPGRTWQGEGPIEYVLRNKRLDDLREYVDIGSTGHGVMPGQTPERIEAAKQIIRAFETASSAPYAPPLPPSVAAEPPPTRSTLPPTPSPPPTTNSRAAASMPEPTSSRPPRVPSAYATERAGTAPPSVSAQYRTERVGRPPAPEGEPQPSGYVADGVRRTVDSVRREEPPASGGGGEPPIVSSTLPADVPENPAPQVSRAARFFGKVKAEFFSRIIPPENVVEGDAGGTRIVRNTYRAYDDGLLLRRELEDKARAVYRGLTDEEIATVNRVLDTKDVTPDQYARLLPPKLAEVAQRARTEIFDAGADATGLGRERRITGYFPRFRDRIRAQQTDLIQVGEEYIPRTVVEDLPKSKPAFFFKPRSIDEPPNSVGLDAVLIYQRAVARHLQLNGGSHPLTGELMPGYLNTLSTDLRAVQPELRQYVGEFINYFLGTPESRTGTPLQNQVSRIAKNIEFARLIGGNLGSPIANMAQQVNTAAWVRPTSFIRGYADMVDPARRALARRYIGLEELAKSDLEMVQQVQSNLDRVEDFTAKMAEVSGVLFRLSESQGNRYHAFLSGLREAEALGLEGRGAIEFARDIVEVSQFPGAGPAKIPLFRGPVGGALGQFKQFQIRQAAHFKRAFTEDVRDYMAVLRGEKEVPLTVTGREILNADGSPVMRELGPTRVLPFHRTAKWIVGLTVLGGPDALFPGLDDYLTEQGVRVPGLFPALGVGISNLMGLGFMTPGDVTRSMLFFLPGPLIGHVQDMMSASTGVNFGHGLTELLHGDVGSELSLDERTDRALRGFLPVAGVGAARGRRALKQVQTPGEERAARTILEALGLEPATGPLMSRTEPGEPIRTAIGVPSRTREKVGEERTDLADMDARAKRAVELAANDMAAGDVAAAETRLRDAERRLKLPLGSLKVSEQAEKAARERGRFTPLERSQYRMRDRFPERVEESRRRLPGDVPEESVGHGLGVPRLRLR